MQTTRVLVAAAAGACAVVVFSGAVASADGETAAEVIEELQSEGFTVNIDRIGTRPLDECVVTNVRNPQQFTQLVPLLGGDDDGGSVLVPAIISKPVSVSLDCTGQ
ncbi:hypothetical protein [Mycobacterium deserti]|uniref:Uncharacterized protein n=1 Tax=Mycobacterium deserti TaxID=2978347 RepID=A0ABT2M4V1_9MYCO|nr:hypothetical protein [Mycobacterium deserti]MCT7657288.1 hypothetical protein [Mycobacterium deserti]